MQKKIVCLCFIIIIFSLMATITGIWDKSGEGSFIYQSIRGEDIEIKGIGLYKHMSSDLAIQGIAQDYITLFMAIPLLILSLLMHIRKSPRFSLILGGVLFYFFVTYLFYLAMGMYNEMFLVYVLLLGASFFALILHLISIDYAKINYLFKSNTPVKTSGVFLIINAFLIAMLWLSIIVPPLLNGQLYPQELEHYTTLIVQGFDLALLLPMAFICGYLMIKKHHLAYVLGTFYLVFLSILMTALSAKIIGMKMEGANVIPVIFIIPTINVISIVFSSMMLISIKSKEA
ncbi:hypothetical protein JEZ13_11545 [bacterium]|nr:hypothetical protein [bacterium]